MRKIGITGALLVLAACGAMASSTEGTASGGGTLGNQSFTPVSAIFSSPVAISSYDKLAPVFGGATPPVTGNAASLVIGEDPAACESFQSAKGGALQLFVIVLDVDTQGNSVPPTVGDYPVNDGTIFVPWTGKSVFVAVGNCMDSGYYATSGKVSLTTVTSTTLAGTYEIDLNLGVYSGHVTGSFTAAPCSGLVMRTGGSC